MRWQSRKQVKVTAGQQDSAGQWVAVIFRHLGAAAGISRMEALVPDSIGGTLGLPG
jgi:hypothetical protein